MDSLKFLVTLIFKTPLVLIKPAKISSPSKTSLGTDSPVRADVSTKLFPFIIIPSKGTLSPGLITIISSKFTSSGETLNSLPFHLY